MQKYTHLTLEQRYQISSDLKSNISISEIARRLGCHKSTISREIKRNTGLRGYRPKQAQSKATARKANNAYRISDFAWAYIKHLLSQYYSPEQINGRLKVLGWTDVPSIETIYQHIYADKAQGGTSHHYLRSQKIYRKRGYKAHDRRGQIANRKDISERPVIIEQRQRLGDYEGDTVVGKGHQGVLVTLVDRTTREVKIKALPNRKAPLVAQTCIELLKDEQVQSITFDNGKEFALHEQIGQGLNTDIYFAKPYHSWERGTNENTNKLIRQFLPKSLTLDTIDDEQIQQIEDNLNNRPRKVLGFRTPLEVKSDFRCVALGS